MDRRHFCKIASLALGSVGLSRVTVSAGNHTAPNTSLMPRPGCRLTVLRREWHTDLQAIFLDDPDTGPCRLYSSGDDFCFQPGQNCPDGFCPRLWSLVCDALDRQPCSPALKDNTLVLACPDGTRPVIVRIDLLK